MSRIARLAAFLGLAAAGCSDPAPPPATGAPPAELERRRQTVEEQSKESDTVARGLMGSFEARVYEPRRDSFLEHAEGTVALKTQTGDALYRFVFDAANPPDRPVRFETVSAPDSIGDRTTADVRNWANLTCIGAFAVVAYYRPPIQWQVVPSTDRKNPVVLAPTYHTAMSVSYSLDARQVVVGRAEWTDETHTYVTHYDWDPFGGGRYLLRRATLLDHATTDFDYGDHEGIRLLDRVRVTDRERPLDATFTYQTVRRATH
jgi:hypothetical protein